MKLALFTAATLAAGMSAAHATEPALLSTDQMDQVSAGGYGDGWDGNSWDGKVKFHHRHHKFDFKSKFEPKVKFVPVKVEPKVEPKNICPPVKAW
jgi:hypothetical protein